jgi:ribonuclease HII
MPDVKLPANFILEKALWGSGKKNVAGLDEVGRGAWAGPLIAAVVIFPPRVSLPEAVYDSKVLTPTKRQKLAKLIKKCSWYYSVAGVGVEFINRWGIGEANRLVFKKAITSLAIKPDYLLSDAFPVSTASRIDQLAIRRGDRLCASIAAASIIAKVYRDKLMVKLASSFPHYGFEKNKGYGTKTHQDALVKHGPCVLHRTSFKNIAALTLP